MTESEDNKIRTDLNTDLNLSTGELKTDTFLNSIVLLSVKTLFYLFLIISVGFASVFQMFPLAAIRFYSGLEDYDKAVKYAQSYAERGGKDYFEVLFEGIRMSDELLYSAKTSAEIKKYAEYLLYFTQSFAGLDNFESACADLDDYYADGAASVLEKVGLYSFKDYVFSSFAASASALNKLDRLMYQGEFMPAVGGSRQKPAQPGYIMLGELNKLFHETGSGSYTPELGELALIFNQISENIVWGEGSLILDDTGDTSFLYDLMLIFIKNDQGYSYVDRVLAQPVSIENLYFLRAAAVLGENIKMFLGSAYGLEDRNDKIDEVKDIFSVSIGGEAVPLYEYYRWELLQ